MTNLGAGLKGYKVKTNIYIAKNSCFVNISFCLSSVSCDSTFNNTLSDYTNKLILSFSGYILSSFFWGYWVTQLPGALICCYFGASKVFVSGLMIAIFCTYFNQLISGWNVWVFMSLRVLIGLGQGVTFPVALNIITSWAPTSEVGIFAALATGGQYLGAVLANSLSGILAASSFLGGWPSLFYVYATIGVIWAVLWLTFVRDSPQESRWVSSAEKKLLNATTAPKQALYFSEIPWKNILTCVPFLSTVFMHGCNGFGYFMILSDLPKYLVEQLHFDIKNSGFIASLPYIITWTGYITSGYISDILISKDILTRTTTRKVVAMLALFIPAILLTSLSFLNNTLPILVLMNIAMFFQGFANSSYYVNYMDLSPRYSAVLCGFGNGLCAVAGLIGPVFVGFLINGIKDHDKLKQQWRIAFAVASAVWVVGCVQYCVFGSGQRQTWDAEIKEDGNINRDDDNESKVRV